MKQDKVIAKTDSSQKSKLKARSKRTQTAEGWRRSVKKICEKRREKSD